MPNQPTYHMTPAEFREQGRALVDWIADYYEQIESYPVLAQVQPGEVRAKLPATPPVQGESFAAMMADVDEIIMPGITHWQSPNFFAFFPTGASFPSILGDLLSSGLGVQGMLWATSPACTELETHVLDWLVDMLGLPTQFLSSNTGGGVIQDSASSASLTALLAARERATGFRQQCHWSGPHAGRLCLRAGAFLHRKGDDDRRAGPREPASGRGRRELRHAPG